MAITKKKLPDDRMRKSFYWASDGVDSLKSLSKETNDEELQEEVAKLLSQLDKVQKILDKKYNWD